MDKPDDMLPMEPADASAVASSYGPDAYVQGVESGLQWSGTIRYSFPTGMANYEASYYDYSALHTSFSAATAAQVAAVRDILGGGLSGPTTFKYGSYSSVIANSIVETANLRGVVNTADIRIADSGYPSTAYAYYPYNDPVGGDIWIGKTYGSYLSPVLGSYGWMTHIHELGHAFGLKHPHDSGVVGGFPAMPTDRDDIEFSVMSYHSYIGSGFGGYTNETYGFAQTLMTYDIAALQFMYGADYTTNAGDTTYRWNANTGEMSLNGTGQGTAGANRIFLTTWDGGGVDTYDLSNYTTNLSIDLAPGGWSSFSVSQLAKLGNGNTARANVYNALLANGDTRSYIENAVGGSGSDTIAGNATANALFGGAGDDILYGADGNDTIDGGAGNDTLYGGAGADLFEVGGSADRDTILDFVQGLDRLGVSGSSLDFSHVATAVSGSDLVLTLGTTGNIVVLAGLAGGIISAGNFSGLLESSLITGDDFDNTLLGTTSPDTIYGAGGNDTLYGDAGDDTLYGGAGNDSLYGAGGNDTLYGGSGAELFDGGDGNDTFYGGQSHTIYGGNGDDIYVSEEFTESGGFFYGGAGNDTLIGGTLGDTFEAHESGDYFSETGLTGGIDYIGVYLANYTVQSWIEQVEVFASGGSTIYGGSGAKTMWGTAATDLLYGGHENDTMYGGDGNDVLYGGAGDDTLVGGGQRDTMSGGAGNDVLVMGGGSNEEDYALDFVQGADRIDITALAVKFSDLQLIPNGDHLVVVKVSTGDILRLMGQQGTTLTASDFIGLLPEGTVYTGDGSNNTFVGTSGPDTLYGLGGDDLLDGAAGNDTFYGGTGNDTFEIRDTGDVAVEAVGEGYDRADIYLSTAYTVGDNIERIQGLAAGGITVTGNGAANTMVGTTLADALSGGAGDDLIYGDAGGDTLYGGSGGDQIYGGDGDDLQYGGALDDVLIGGAGNDTAFGGDGNDYFEVRESGDVFVEQALEGSADNIGIYLSSAYTVGDEIERLYALAAGGGTITGGNTANTMVGSAVTDVLSGAVGIDTLYGDAGDDTLYGGLGNDLLYGDAGSDTAFGGLGDDLFEVRDAGDVYAEAAGEGSDRIAIYTSAAYTIGANIERVLGLAAGGVTITGVGGDDVMSGGTSTDVLSGGIGVDQLYGDAGNDTLYGGADIDVLYGDAGDDTLDGGAGNDYFLGGTGNDVAIGGAGDDFFEIRDSGDVFVEAAGEGYDFAAIYLSSAYTLGDNVERIMVLGAGGTVTGGATNDVMTGSTSTDVLSGSAGVDQVYGDAGTDTLYGGADNDVLYGADGDDTLHGDSGNDILIGGIGNDTAFGGTGDDYFEVRQSGDALVEAAGEGTGDYVGIYLNSAYTVGDNIEVIIGLASGITVTGGETDNIVYGTVVADVVSGAGGNDQLYGDLGNDTLYGGSGNDLLMGSTGSDTGFGGLGDDQFEVLDAGDVFVEAVGEGFDRAIVYTTAAWTVGDNVERIFGLAGGGVTITGGATDNIVSGGVQTDVLSGAAGNDQLYGDAGVDTLYGGADNDVLYGDAGDDTAFGGSGNDIFVGGTGSDTGFGGLGDDYFEVREAGDLFVEAVGEGTADGVGVYISSSYTVGDNIERIFGFAAGGVTLTGNAGANEFYGSEVTDVMSGGAGDDTLFGGAGDDTLFGGADNDTFVFASVSGGSGTDTIADFGSGDSVLVGSNTVVSGDGTAAVILADGTQIVAGNGHLWNQALDFH